MAEEFNVNPYFDDFDESKNFYRILFKPGLAVQARELTQIQTIINNQQKRFADHIFQDGSKITGGQTFFNKNVKYLAIENTFGGNPVVVEEFLDKVITGGTSGAKARVVHVNEAEDDDPTLLFLEILTGDTPTTSSTFDAGENIATEEGLAANAETVDHFGDASIFSIDEGVFYIDGFFVFVPEQTITLEKFNNTPTFRVGLTLLDEVITVNEDDSLLDPARGAPNFQGEGADRFRKSLILDKKRLDFTEDVNNASSEKFIELVRIEDGLLRREVKYPIYSDIMQTMARRTFDESGDYTVSPFRINIEDDEADETKLVVKMEPGKAFVKGFEFETIATESLPLDKARETLTKQNRDVVAKYGNFALVNNLAGSFAPTQLMKVTLHDTNIAGISDQTDLDNSEIGTAYLRHIDYDQGTGGNLTYRFYLFRFDFNGTSSFANVESIWGSNFSGGIQADIDTTNGQDGSGNSLLFSTTFNRGLFLTPFETVKTLAPDTILDTDYITQKRFPDISFTSGTASISTTGSNTFFGGSGALTDTIKREHYLAVITSLTNAGSTGLGVGDVIDFTAGSRSITLSGGDQLASFDVDDGAFVADVTIIATINLNVKPEKVKTLTSTTVSGVTLSSGVGDLAISDVFKIIEIRDTGDSNAIVTDRFTLDTGQRDNFYDHGSIQLKSGESVVGPLDVDIEYFAHSGAGYFSVDSYVGIDYEDIPSYQLSAGGTVRLSDVFDFRPRRTDGGDDFTVGTGIDLAKPNTNINMDIEFYLSKYVNVNVTSDLQFVLQEGTSEIEPVPPRTPQNSMTLYQLRVPAFTFSPTDVNSIYIDNRRFTMRDIGGLEKRLSRIEYYTALSLLEKNTTDLLVTDIGGNELFKNGILVDAFKDHRIGDFGNPDYRCSIDTHRTRLRPEAIHEYFSLEYNDSESVDTSQQGDGVTVSYNETNIINQPLASLSIPLNPFSVAVWQGDIVMSPQTDQWVDTETDPDYIDRLTGGNASLQNATSDDVNWSNKDNSFYGRYQGWEDFWGGTRDDGELLDQYNALGLDAPGWYGTQYIRSEGTGNLGRAVSALATKTSIGLGFLYDQVSQMVRNPVSVIQKTIGDRITDINFVPFIRAQDIEFSATNLKPNSRLYIFFDDIDVTDRVTPTGDSLGDPLFTDENGKCSGTFSLPNDDTLRFRTGQKSFKLVDNPSGDVENATTSAISQFFAQGLITTRAANVQSTRPIEVKNADPNSTQIQTDPVTRDSSNLGKRSQAIFRDPVAQVFTVDTAIFSSGVYITSVEVAFQAKDDTLPVTCEIRPTVNGFPHSSIKVPFSQVTLEPGEVSVSEDGTILTKFEFRVPVFLEGGEYALVLSANTNNYRVYAAQLGDLVLNTNQRIVSQPYTGAFFKSQNASIWSPELDKDLTFKINRAVFDTGVTAQAVYDLELPTSDFEYDSFNILGEILDPPGTSVSVEYKRRDLTSGVLDAEWTPVSKETVINLPARAILNSAGPATSFKVRTTMTTSNDAVSPLIDTERKNLIVMQNSINNDDTDEELSTGGAAEARYISRQVVLRDGLDATGMKVFLNANIPSGTEIQVYARVLSADDGTAFLDRGWIELPRVGNISDISRNEDEIIELEYEEIDLSYDGFTDYKTWAIKIVMLSPSTSIIPTVKDFRAIAVT